MSAESVSQARELHRLERPALAGVLVREIINFRSFWRSATFSSTVDPTIYLLAFGFGFGSLVSSVNGYDYVEYVGTGTVATAVLFSSAMPSMFGTFVKYRFQRTYDAILAAPVDTEELVTAENLWIAVRAGTYGCVPMLVAIVFGLTPEWTMIFVPPIAFVSGFGWAGFGTTVAATLDSIDNFSYVMSGVITPMFLVAGTFFPLNNLATWVQVLAQLNPLYHTVQLVRAAAFDSWSAVDIWHAGFLIVFGLAMWRLAIWRMTLRLVD
jgi:lipooligosaccharide transport system permease protein